MIRARNKQILALNHRITKNPTFWTDVLDDVFNTGLEHNEPFKVEAFNTGESYVLKAEAPGIEKEDVSIDLKNDVLNLSFERKKSTSESNDKFSIREINYGKISRNFTVPENVNREEISATLKNGILTVTMPIQHDKRNKRILVNTG